MSAPPTTVQIQATPDTDVRPVTPGAPRDRGPRAFLRVARSLLIPAWRSLFLVAVASSMSACVIPVAPEFQDPPPAPDAPPWIVSSKPEPVSVPVTIPPQGMAAFSANVADATAGATIFYQWVFDYPPYDSNLTRSLGGAQMTETGPAGQPVGIPGPSISCTGISPPPGPGPNHLFALILADAPFSNNRLGQFDDGTGMAPTYIWPVDMPCPATTTVTP